MKTSDISVLKKSDALMFFASVASKMRLIAPKRQFADDVMFDYVESTKEIVWDYGHDIYPPKRFLLPQVEDMLKYRTGKGVKVEAEIEAPKQAIVGIRSCDVTAIRFQERFFGNPIVDPYYKARLDNTVFFSLVCNKPPKKECFCMCCDAGPYLDSGFDVQLTDLGDRFMVEIGNEKGGEACAPGTHMLSKAQPKDFAERRQIELQADSLFETQAYIAKAINFISNDDVPDQVWEEIAETCFRCGACTNLCPVCTCYTVDDIKLADGSYVRSRSWDSCQYAGFTREASGHNPRPTPGSRMSRRFYHKATYQYIMRDGRHGCAGCGRCVTTCLADLGVPTVIKRIRRAMPKYFEPQEKAAEV